jgi:diguanylate cyclase (GGDEF)-like protein
MRRRTSVSLLIFDIDDFKDVNDEYGHLLGDRVLQGVASEVERISRVEDPVCRIGGEEFAVILLGQSASDAQLFAERIRHTVTALSFPMDTHVTVSVGLAEVPANASTPRDLFACADLALRTAKAEGKNRVCAYAGRTLGFRWDASNDYPLAGRWQILARGVGGGAGRAGRSIGHMETIASLTSRLTRAQDVAATAGAIRDELESLATYRSCSVYVLAGDGTTLISAIPPRNPRARGRGRVSALRRATAEDAVRLGDIIHVPEESSPSPADGRGHSLVATPLRFEDRVIGVLVVSRLEGGAFDHDDARLLSAVGSIAAIALQNARLAEAQRDTGRNLDGAYPSTGIAVSGQP